jgi:hypothetical protein
MTASAGSKAKKKVNSKLLYVLGAVFVLALGMKMMPGLLGGGSGVKPFRPVTTFHYHKTPIAAPSPGGTKSGTVLVRTSRDPFAQPPGVTSH